MSAPIIKNAIKQTITNKKCSKETGFLLLNINSPKNPNIETKRVIDNPRPNPICNQSGLDFIFLLDNTAKSKFNDTIRTTNTIVLVTSHILK